MKVFRFILVVAIATMLVYTIKVGYGHGWNFAPIFLRDIVAMNWAGQFNLDFSFLLLFTGLWIAWRNKGNLTGIVLGLFTFVGGIPFISTYLLVLSFKSKSIKEVIIGINN